MEVHAEEILGLIGITLMEIVGHLEATHGLRVAHSSVWRLLDRHGTRFCGGAEPGSSFSPISPPSA
jgi:hypothetical protein